MTVLFIVLPAIVTFLIVYVTQSKTFRKNLIREEFDDDYREVSRKIGTLNYYEGLKMITVLREKWIHVVEFDILSDACNALTEKLKRETGAVTP